MKRPRIITIDGPAGAGKSTVAREIARRFGYLHLDSGALYRAIGYACKERGVNLNDGEAVLKVARSLSVELLPEGRVLLNGEDVTERIRTPEGGALAARVAQYPEVREIVVELLRKMARGKRVVIDGRDAGSYIFPDADLKIYLTASPEERARRRYEELLKKGFKVSYEKVLKEVLERDRMDESRKFAPLKVPEGAVTIDTTGKSLEEVISEISKLIDP
ncbi:MAG: (d)CMP kinase [Thermovibrio sp.]|nr:MAG: (d)CMP kinase [Thermovibrio sp.]